MSLSEVELARRAVDRYAIIIIGGNTVFLADRMLGHKVYMGPYKSLPTAEFRKYVLTLNNDLANLTIDDFFAKYRLKG